MDIKEGGTPMKKVLIISTTIISLVITLIYLQKKYELKNPAKLLQGIKHQFIGVESSYISYTPERYRKFGMETQIFKGGVTTNYDNVIEDYEIIFNAYTGELIDCINITHNN